MEERMKNSAYGILSIIFGVISVACLGNCAAFFPIAFAIVFALMGIADPEKQKWSSITGLCLVVLALFLCCGNICLKNSNISTLLSGDSVFKATMDYY